MPSSYPGGLDALTNPTASDTLDSVTVPHATQHTDLNNAVEAVQGELGVDPAGAFATVVARLNAGDTGPHLLSDGAVGAPAYSFSGDTDTGLYRIGANNFAAAVNGAKVLDVTTTGVALTGKLTEATQVSITGANGFTPWGTTSFTNSMLFIKPTTVNPSVGGADWFSIAYFGGTYNGDFGGGDGFLGYILSLDFTPALTLPATMTGLTRFTGIACHPTVTGAAASGITQAYGIHNYGAFGSGMTSGLIATAVGIYSECSLLNATTAVQAWFVAKASTVEVLRLTSTATNDDPRESVFQARVATTDATVTTLQTLTIPSSTTVLIETRVVARRTGGSAGTADDGAGYVRWATVKGVSGTAALIGSVTAPVTNESVAGYNCTIDVTSNTARVRITGVTNTNITWHCTTRIYPVST